jgi:flagellar biogenesis protein FliO
MAMPAMGQSTQPAAAAADQTQESLSLRITDSDAKAATLRATGTSATQAGTADLSRIAIALIVVISLILLLRAAYRQMTAGPGGARGGKLVTVLSRSMVSPKQHVLVLQVGKRLLVVGDSGGHMTSLCEISDPDEVATLIGQTRGGASASKGPVTFGSLFRRANEPFSETEVLQSQREEQSNEINPDDSVSQEEVGGLLDKVRQLQQQFNEQKQPQS